MNRIRIRLAFLLFCTLCVASCTSTVTRYPYISSSTSDGRYGVFGDREKGEVVVKEITTGRIVKVWNNNIFDLIGGAVGFTSDKRYFVLPIKNSIELWKLKDGTLKKTLVTNSNIYSFAINSTNTYLAASDMDGGINLWDLDDGRHLWQMQFAKNRSEEVHILKGILSVNKTVTPLAHRLVFSHDGKYLAIAGLEFIKIYAIPSGKETNWIALNQPRDSNTHIMDSIIFSNADSYICCWY
ncbi:MAG: hypothetical protein U0586_05870 [Candidatus Brocadiaceae bacterium]